MHELCDEYGSKLSTLQARLDVLDGLLLSIGTTFLSLGPRGHTYPKSMPGGVFSPPIWRPIFVVSLQVLLVACFFFRDLTAVCDETFKGLEFAAPITSQESSDSWGRIPFHSMNFFGTRFSDVFRHFHIRCMHNLLGPLFPYSRCSCSGTPSFSFVSEILFLLLPFFHFDIVGDIVTSPNGLLVLPLLSPIHDYQIPSCG